ncbi:TPA: ead/Ea22-like family protein [Klebsiella pneumoniae]|nr:ead/Ea22-like family protein [Klebsiella pneumoniae]MDU7296981.1 ead/Ea22-like family protein [Klebsiella pneumoniae]MDU7447662.1 ead/Ea22-like family protein [Klebsiella pneumoniae]MDU7705323.1 ead/Ea22-like family protein [Klebsiella pneumoniae]HBQ0245632.1 ead/Ea22-like family protein [Klebsiella pneumoniae]
MTTDITELAQSLKAAANTTADAIDRLKEFPGDELIDLSQHEGEQVDIDITTLNEWYELSSPANVLVLVEALEKAQQRIGKLEKKLTDHKRMNQEMAKAMLTPNDSDAAEMEIAALRQRIAGLESRTVKLPLPSCTYADHSYPAYTKQQVLTMLESLGVTVVEEDV